MSNAFAHDYVAKLTCSFCLNTKEGDEAVDFSVIRGCGHLYHTSCIEGWIIHQREHQHGSVCPNCKHRIHSRTSKRDIRTTMITRLVGQDVEARECQEESQQFSLIDIQTAMLPSDEPDMIPGVEDDEATDDEDAQAPSTQQMQREMRVSLQNLRRQVETLTRERDEARAAAGTELELQGELRAANQQLSQLQDEHFELGMAKQSAETELAMVQQSQRNSEADKQRRVDELARVLSKRDEYQQEMVKQRQQLSEQRSGMRALQNRVAELEKAEQESKRRHDQELQKVKQDQDDALVEHLTQEAKLEAEKKKAEAEAAAFQDRLSKIVVQRNKLKQNVADLEEQVKQAVPITPAPPTPTSFDDSFSLLPSDPDHFDDENAAPRMRPLSDVAGDFVPAGGGVRLRKRTFGQIKSAEDVRCDHAAENAGLLGNLQHVPPAAGKTRKRIR